MFASIWKFHHLFANSTALPLRADDKTILIITIVFSIVGGVLLILILMAVYKWKKRTRNAINPYGNKPKPTTSSSSQEMIVVQETIVIEEQ